MTEQTQTPIKGPKALFTIQIFSTLSYAVLYSTLVLFMKQGLGISTENSNTIMGSFIAFNYGLHMLGGYFGGRNLSLRNLFVLGIALQVVGCLLLALVNLNSYFWGLASFLTGSGLNVTCMNLLVTQLFEPEDKRREAAFLWNYSGMNLGFFLGFTLAGYFQLSLNFDTLFITSSLSGILAIILCACNWNTIRDRNTILSRSDKSGYWQRVLIGLAAIFAMIPALRWLMEHATFSNQLVIYSGVFMMLMVLYLAIKQRRRHDRLRIYAFIILALISLLFWSLYQLAPMGLTVFALYNVDRVVMGFTIAPQWIQNINTIVIVLGGPSMIIFLKKIRKHTTFSIPLQFAFSMVFIGLGFVILPIGIHFANAQGLMSFSWIAWSYILQSIGELLISPIGYAMIGLLAPKDLQGILMGTWMLIQGVAGVISSYLSNYAIHSFTSNNPLVTNPGYSQTFGWLGYSALAAAVLMFILVPLLRRLINEKHG